jgi:hypothetical protein
VLKVLKNTAYQVTLDDLYARAISQGMRVEIDSRGSWGDSATTVELSCKNDKGSRFTFKGLSANNINEAFMNAFEQASIIGMGYE